MQQGCLATPTTCGVIDSQRDLYITDRQLTRGGQWCVSCFWPGIRVLNSHGPPAGWHKAYGSLRAAFLIGSDRLFLFLSFLPQTGGEERRSGRAKKKKKKNRGRELGLWMCWNVTHVPKIPDSSHHSNTPLLDGGKLGWTDSDIKTQTCSRGTEWMTVEKPINSPTYWDSFEAKNICFFFLPQFARISSYSGRNNTLISGMN